MCNDLSNDDKSRFPEHKTSWKESEGAVPYSTLFVSIFLFVVIPLLGGIFTRMTVIRNRGEEYFE